MQSNALAETLGRWYRMVQPYMKWGGLALLAISAITAAVAFASYRRRMAEGRAWAELFATATALSAGDHRQALQDIANVHPGTTAAQWAAITRADTNLIQATQLLYQSRDEAQKLLREAVELYQQVVPQVRDPYLIQRVEFGRGQALESLGELRQAEAAYSAVVAKGETTALGQLAKRRLDQLAKDDLRKFYDWLVAQRTPTFPKGSTSLDLSLPDRPDITIPGAPSAGGGQAGSGPANPPALPERSTAETEGSGAATPPGNNAGASQDDSGSDQKTPSAPAPSSTKPLKEPQGEGTDKPTGTAPEKADGRASESGSSQPASKLAPESADKPAGAPLNR